MKPDLIVFTGSMPSNFLKKSFCFGNCEVVLRFSSDAIHTTTIDGTDLREVIRGGDTIQHPFAIAVYGSHVYWTDWRTNAIHKVSSGFDQKAKLIMHPLHPFDPAKNQVKFFGQRKRGLFI